MENRKTSREKKKHFEKKSKIKKIEKLIDIEGELLKEQETSHSLLINAAQKLGNAVKNI